MKQWQWLKHSVYETCTKTLDVAGHVHWLLSDGFAASQAFWDRNDMSDVVKHLWTCAYVARTSFPSYFYAQSFFLPFLFADLVLCHDICHLLIASVDTQSDAIPLQHPAPDCISQSLQPDSRSVVCASASLVLLQRAYGDRPVVAPQLWGDGRWWGKGWAPPWQFLVRVVRQVALLSRLFLLAAGKRHVSCRLCTETVEQVHCADNACW